MNTIQNYLLVACLAGATLCTLFLLAYRFRDQARQLWNRWLALGPAGRTVTFLFAAVLFVYGSTKPTNRVGAASLLPESENLTPPLLTLTSGLDLISRWTARGAWIDWKEIEFPAGFAFPIGTNELHSLVLMSNGELCPQLTTNNQQPTTILAALPERVSLEPSASSVTHGMTPSNSYLFAWSNACIERNATNRCDASIELFRNGSIAVSFQPTTTNQTPTTVLIPAQLPDGYVGVGQDIAWATNAFPFAATNIAAMGYTAWLDDYIGINEPNGRYQAKITISSLPDGPCYLVCGPYKVNVTTNGTYCFPLEVFETYKARTYPTAVPLSIETDDGYRTEGTHGLMMTLPPMMLADASGGSNEYEIHEEPRLVLSPTHIWLSQAVGTHISIWCNIVNATRRFIAAAANEFYLNFCFPSDAEIIEAEVATTVEIILENSKGSCSGTVCIEDDLHEDEPSYHLCCWDCCGEDCRCNGTCCDCNCGCYSGTNDCTSASSP